MFAFVLAEFHAFRHLTHSRPRQWTPPELLTLLCVIETRLKELFVLLIPVAGCWKSFPPRRLWCLLLEADSFASSEISLRWICGCRSR